MSAGRVALYSAARIYGGIMALRNWAYDRRVLPVRAVSIPVISIGNVTAGGNAKTPLTMLLARELAARNMRPAVLTRGYGGSFKGPVVVTAEHKLGEIGDEPFLMYRRFAEDKLAVPIVIARERIKGARLIEEQGSADVILLDDGFQHRRLHRDIDIVSVNVGTEQALQEFMQGALLPRGRFREDRDAALARCDILIFSERKPAAGAGELNQKLLRVAPKGIQLYRSFVKVRDFVDLYGPCPLEEPNIAIVCGIANPENFIRTVESLGFSIKGRREYPDHYEFSREEMQSIRGEFGDIPIICTEKDFVKLMQFSDVKLYALRIEAEIRPRDAFVSQIMRMLLQAKEQDR